MTRLYFAIDNALIVVTISGESVGCDLGLIGYNIGCLAVDPLRPQSIYFGTIGSGLWRSENGGESWQPAGQGIPHSKVQAVAVSRLERLKGASTVYAGTEPSTIFRSEDAGATWQECKSLTAHPSANEWSFPPRPETHHVRWIEPDPCVPERLFAAIEAGALIRSPDAGNTWQDRLKGSSRDTHQLWIHPSSPGRILSAAGDGFFESHDGGDTWQKFEEGLRYRCLWSIAVDTADSDNIIVSAASSAQHSYSEPAESRLYRRKGDSPWQELRNGLPNPAGRHSAVQAAHPNEPGTFFAVWQRDLFQSVNGAVSWHCLDVPWPQERRVNETCGVAVAS